MCLYRVKFSRIIFFGPHLELFKANFTATVKKPQK